MKYEKFIMSFLLSVLFACIIMFFACVKDDDTSASGSNGNSGCPTTSACGCSSYTQAECDAHTVFLNGQPDKVAVANNLVLCVTLDDVTNSNLAVK
jgi:hypothetical protein